MAGLLNANNVGDLYQKHLGRAPEAGAADFWVKQSENGADVEKSILGSQEYLGKQKAPQQQNIPTPVSNPSNNADAVKALAQGYTASQVNVAPESTSQFQLGKMLDSGSPLMKLSETQGLQQANKRGLLNSSIAVGAAQDSMIRAATPFAQQDASTYANAQTFNANAQNQSNQFSAAAQNTASLNNADIASRTQIQDKQNASQQTIYDAVNANKLQIANLDVTAKQALTKIDADNRQLLQTNINAADMYKQYAANLASISSNANLSQEAKDAALQNQINTLRAGLDAIGEVSSLNLSKYFEVDSIQKPAAPVAPIQQRQPIEELTGD
tara:strand:+ start:111 stop:1091 length:981 start_codon:yes stop_codon:yes gene_type:complete